MKACPYWQRLARATPELVGITNDPAQAGFFVLHLRYPESIARATIDSADVIPSKLPRMHPAQRSASRIRGSLSSRALRTCSALIDFSRRALVSSLAFFLSIPSTYITA